MIFFLNVRWERIDGFISDSHFLIYLLYGIDTKNHSRK